MIRISQIKLPVEDGENNLRKKVIRILRAKENDIKGIEIKKRSLDARKKPELYYVYTVDVDVVSEKKFSRAVDGKKIMYTEKKEYIFPEAGKEVLKHRPVVVGSGPAGLICSWMLAKYGYRPVLLERGDEAFKRKEKVDAFWDSGTLDPQSNVQFGEGGAGTFSDGKLNTSVKDPSGRIHKVLSLFVQAGAPESILYDHKPHLGTDVLVDLVTKLREQIIEMGGEVHFRSQMTNIRLNHHALEAIEINGKQWMDASVLILAIGHSARDTVSMLYEAGVSMSAKSFAVGLRAEHPQDMIDMDQYGKIHTEDLGAAAYKLTHQLENGRGIYSFCMCPGGWVVNASSEDEHLAVNGMSYQARDSRNANSALIVTVHPSDYEAYGMDQPEPLRGIAFQRYLEKAAYRMAHGKVPVQLYDDFCKNIPSTGPGSFEPCIKGAYAYTNLREILPKEIGDSIADGIKAFGRKIKGFDRPDCILSGIESRTSSPVRMERDIYGMSSIQGIYPCGEGAGYAGGITSAAVDGLKVAEAIRKKFRNLEFENGLC